MSESMFKENVGNQLARHHNGTTPLFYFPTRQWVKVQY